MPGYRSFSRQLELVTRNARHYMDEPTFDRVRKVVEDYAKRCLGAAVFDLFQYQTVYLEREGKPGLRPVWRDDRAFPIRYSDGGLSGQCAFCFHHQRPIWIVAKETKHLLAETTDYEDLWSGLPDIPPYLDSIDVAARTLICVPVPPRRRSRQTGSISGVVNLESESRLSPTGRAKAEIQSLAASLHTLFSLKEQHDRAMEYLNTDLDELHLLLSTSRELDLLVPPKLFFACAEKADPKIVGAIRKILSEYEGQKKIKVVDWKKQKERGVVDRQILQQLGESAYGVCYFSEPDSGKQGHFFDSPTALFEAGMLQARGDQLADLQSWIPIRESKSPPTPFDFLRRRTLPVPRLNEEEINMSSFESELKARLEDLLSRGGNS